MCSEIRKLLKSTRDDLDRATSIFEVLPTIDKGINEPYLKFLYINTEKALRLANGAYYSCYHGHPIGGIGAARSIYEICITIQHVNKAPKERIKDFVRKETEKPLAWPDSRIETMAKKNKRNDYKSVYGHLSHISHIGAMLMDDYMERADQNEIQIKSELSSEEYCIRVLSATHPCLNQILQVFMETFGVQPQTSSPTVKTNPQKPNKILILVGELLEYARSYIHGQLKSIKLSRGLDGMYSVFLYIHTHLALDLAHGAYHNCCYGWPIGGIGAVRSIYEICLNVMYVESGMNKTIRNGRLERFMMSVTEARHDTMTSGIGRENLQRMDEERKQKIGNQYKEYKAKYEKMIPPYEKNRWAGISRKKMAQEVGWEKAHGQVYELLSQISHVSEMVINDEIKGQVRNEMQCNSSLNPSNEYLVEVLDVIFEYIPIILDEYMEAFMVPLEIQRLRRVIQNIQNDYKKEVLTYQESQLKAMDNRL